MFEFSQKSENEIEGRQRLNLLLLRSDRSLKVLFHRHLETTFALARGLREMSVVSNRPALVRRPRHITLSEARSRLDQRRFSRPNTLFSAFFEIYKNIIFSEEDFAKIFKILQKFWHLSQNFRNYAKIWENLLFLKIFAESSSEKMIFL